MAKTNLFFFMKTLFLSINIYLASIVCFAQTPTALLVPPELGTIEVSTLLAIKKSPTISRSVISGDTLILQGRGDKNKDIALNNTEQL